MAVARAELINLATNKSTDIELPINEDDWYDALAEIGLEDDADSDEYKFDDFTFYDIDLQANKQTITVAPDTRWEEVNEIVEKIDAVNDYDKEKLEAVVEVRGLSDLEDIGESIDDLDDYYYYSGVNDSYDLAEAIIDEHGGIGQLGQDTLEQYFDYEAYGNDVAYDGTFTAKGFLME